MTEGKELEEIRTNPFIAHKATKGDLLSWMVTSLDIKYGSVRCADDESHDNFICPDSTNEKVVLPLSTRTKKVTEAINKILVEFRPPTATAKPKKKFKHHHFYTRDDHFVLKPAKMDDDVEKVAPAKERKSYSISEAELYKIEAETRQVLQPLSFIEQSLWCISKALCIPRNKREVVDLRVH
jgi:hypothetical protein